MDSLLGYCGLFCGACSFKVAFETNDRRHLAGMPRKYSKYADAVLQFCPGCSKDEDEGCEIRNCARAHGFLYCGLCPDAPCSLLRRFSEDGIPHHSEVIANIERIKKVGVKEWLKEQKERWTCDCGAKRSWYLERCTKCGRVF